VIWNGDAAVRARIPDLQTLVGLTPAALASQIGEARATAVIAYLRANPHILTQRTGTETLVTAH
jgi:high-affinity iron transporter